VIDLTPRTQERAELRRRMRPNYAPRSASSNGSVHLLESGSNFLLGPTLLDMLVQLSEKEESLGQQVEMLKEELNTSQVRLFSDLQDLIRNPGNRERISSHIRMFIPQINILWLHRSTKMHTQQVYLVYNALLFHGGYVTHYTSDHTGSVPWGNLDYRTTAFGACYLDKLPARRKQVTGDLLQYASDAWKPALTKWHSEL
jgi:hypothetical protein